MKGEMKMVKFVKYTGEFPNLCSGNLTLEIDGETVTFDGIRERFWCSGGKVSFVWGNDNVETGEWIIHEREIPAKYRKYASEIAAVFRENVRKGCCGGCL